MTPRKISCCISYRRTDSLCTDSRVPSNYSSARNPSHKHCSCRRTSPCAPPCDASVSWRTEELRRIFCTDTDRLKILSTSATEMQQDSFYQEMNVKFQFKIYLFSKASVILRLASKRKTFQSFVGIVLSRAWLLFGFFLASRIFAIHHYLRGPCPNTITTLFKLSKVMVVYSFTCSIHTMNKVNFKTRDLHMNTSLHHQNSVTNCRQYNWMTLLRTCFDVLALSFYCWILFHVIRTCN